MKRKLDAPWVTPSADFFERVDLFSSDVYYAAVEHKSKTGSFPSNSELMYAVSYNPLSETTWGWGTYDVQKFAQYIKLILPELYRGIIGDNQK